VGGIFIQTNQAKKTPKRNKKKMAPCKRWHQKFDTCPIFHNQKTNRFLPAPLDTI